jgi:hypothetical protein
VRARIIRESVRVMYSLCAVSAILTVSVIQIYECCPYLVTDLLPVASRCAYMKDHYVDSFKYHCISREGYTTANRICRQWRAPTICTRSEIDRNVEIGHKRGAVN